MENIETKESFPKTEWSISNKLYLGSFAVRKKIISATFPHPVSKKDICHRFHIGELEHHATPEEFTKHLKYIREQKHTLHINKTDLTHELNIFVPKPTKKAVYFYFEVCDNGKSLPLHYAAIYNRDIFDVFEQRGGEPHDYEKGSPNWVIYLQACQKELSEYVYMEKVHPSYYFDLFTFFHEFGFGIYEWIDKTHPDYIDEPLDIKWLSGFKRRFEQLKDNGMRNYALAVLNNVLEQSFEDKDFMKCEYCGKLINYHKGKRYCSLASEKRDCAKKARNKRYYAQTGHKNLDKYRRKTKETRAYYKERKVKKQASLNPPTNVIISAY